MSDRPNTSNAHIRKDQPKSKRTTDSQADDAKRLLEDPAFVRGYDALREGIINELEKMKHDGQPETDAYERELCRVLRTLPGLRRALSLAIQGKQLRLAEFRPRESDAA